MEPTRIYTLTQLQKIGDEKFEIPWDKLLNLTEDDWISLREKMEETAQEHLKDNPFWIFLHDSLREYLFPQNCTNDELFQHAIFHFKTVDEILQLCPNTDQLELNFEQVKKFIFSEMFSAVVKS